MTYTFDTEPNSYFRGQDMRVSNEEDTILLSEKDGMWAVNVKDDTVRSQYPADVRAALDLLPDSIASGLYDQAVSAFWDDADLLAVDHNLTQVTSTGRSSGWLAITETKAWESPSPAEPLESEREQVQEFLTFAFAAVAAIDQARDDFFGRVREAMGELQLELRDASDWVGAEVSSLDGHRFTIERLDIRDGRAIFTEKKPAKGFSFSNEVTLIAKGDSALPYGQCNGCGRMYPSDKPGHNIGCVIGALLTTLEDRGFDFAGTDIANIDADAMWEHTFGPVADEIERVLEVSNR